jgi:hypothetical protein
VTRTLSTLCIYRSRDRDTAVTLRDREFPMHARISARISNGTIKFCWCIWIHIVPKFCILLQWNDTVITIGASTAACASLRLAKGLRYTALEVGYRHTLLHGHGSLQHQSLLQLRTRINNAWLFGWFLRSSVSLRSLVGTKLPVREKRILLRTTSCMCTSTPN